MPKPARGKRDEQTRPARRRAQDVEPKKGQRTATRNTRAPRNPVRTRDLDTNKDPKGDEERRPTATVDRKQGKPEKPEKPGKHVTPRKRGKPG